MVPIEIPPEITSFFESDWGRSLMIKGRAGTGKTILSLSMMEKLGDIENTFYISTRVANDSLYSQFHWLRDKEWRENLIDASMDFLRVLSKGKEFQKFKERKEDAMERVEKAREMLAVMKGGQESWRKEPPQHVSRSMLDNVDIKEGMMEIQDIYNRVDKRLPNRSLIIIDSIEALVERYNIDPKVLIKTLQKDLVERSGVKLILVIEEDVSTEWDYLVDGYITLKEGESEGKRVRHIYLNKLRGEKITRPVYLMTLDKGRFNYFQPFKNKLPILPTEKLPIDDESSDRYQKQDSFSTGSQELDELLDFGLPRNSLVLLEIAESVPLTGKMNIIGPLIINFLMQGGKVVNIPITSREDSELRSWFKDTFDENLSNRLITFRPEQHLDTEEETKFNSYRNRVKDVYKEALYRYKKPLLTVCEMENVEDALSYISDDVEEETAGRRLLDIMKENSALVIGVIRPGLKISQKLKNISEIHLRLFSEHNTLMFTGEKPNLSLYNISQEQDTERPRFIPLV
ncbi:MAG: gas vesicle protein GvpD P-loop domain-containing protein [Candidatus Saliniplasma sp.]